MEGNQKKYGRSEGGQKIWNNTDAGTDTIMDTGTHVLSWTKKLIMAKKNCL
jgi:hypothetical protein